MEKNLFGYSMNTPKLCVPKLATTLPKPKKERTLKQSEKNRLIREKKRKCQRCHKSFPVCCLEVHHKKPVHTYRDGSSLYDILIQQPQRRPAYDWKNNLMVVCANCHKKIHYKHSGDIKKKKKRKKTQQGFFPAPSIKIGRLY